VPTKRRYSSALRDEQTAMTRRRILATAGALFVERGYLGPTLPEIAAAAHVSVQTVYNVVGTKPALLKAVYDAMLAGDDEPVPINDRPTMRALRDAADGRTCLAWYAKLGRELAERVLPLANVLIAQAATGDPDLRAFVELIEGQRATGNRSVAEHIATRFGLRDGLDVDGATDILWTLSAPEVADRLVRRRGWGWDRTERWLADTMADALLGPEVA
jgi:AcrR family transcriptional regulator